MNYLVAIPITFIYTAILWVAVICLYNLLIEPFDFGPLGLFAGKSAILIMAVTLTVAFIPLGGLVSLFIWWIGLVVLFKKSVFECKVLVLLLWGVGFIFGIIVHWMFLSEMRSPVSTV